MEQALLEFQQLFRYKLRQLWRDLQIELLIQDDLVLFLFLAQVNLTKIVNGMEMVQRNELRHKQIHLANVWDLQSFE